ncbi:MAG: tRNA (guanosine(18)-2'-O)-methyltransferase TrmH [Gemmatimonadetes bacterium]|nr:tRNA (guanosine(18)-2'-O)-methyltransferase TrmH [Gemmatimonadota bacterium]
MRPERFRRLREVLDRRQPDLTVLMERVDKPHNFSAILRNCDAVGVLEAHVVPPRHGLDLSQATSAGTDKWVAVRRHADVAAAAEHLKALGFGLVAAHPASDAVDYRDVDFTAPTALLMGAELHGLGEEALALADVRVIVPMEGMVRSLNVSVATALLLYEARRQREEAGMYERPRLPADVYERLLFEWAHPRLARDYRGRGEPYPALDEEGGVLAPGGIPGTPGNPRSRSE